jgi:hypothetical protein
LSSFSRQALGLRLRAYRPLITLLSRVAQEAEELLRAVAALVVSAQERH